MCDPNQIIQYQELLATHRRTLMHYLQQAAHHGGVALAPPVTANGIAEARAGIRHCKDVLYGWGVGVHDHPDDIAPPAAFPTSLDQRNRTAMLQKVRDTWVTGLLEGSLHNAALIVLGMQTRPDAVSHPWATIVQLPDRPPCQLPAGTPIVQVFDDLRGELLILGAPGSGKTTMLLELARALLDRAEADLSHPIPIVFHLSTWATGRLPLATWLMMELRERYDVPQELAQAWVDADVVLPLLDGLDEVQAEYRDACVDVINGFHTEHNLVSLVVCSRIADYEALTSRIRLRGAVQLQPLTAVQVDDYLEGAGDQLAGLRLAMTDDPSLRELTESPLVLSVMMLAYQGQPAAALADLAQRRDRLRHLFAVYVQRMLTRRRSGKQAVPAQICRWLVWLAGGMVVHSQSMFYIEYLQPTWLMQGMQRRVYRLLFGLVFGLIAGLVGGLVEGVLDVLTGLSGESSIKLVATLVDGLVFGVVFGVVFGLVFGLVSGLHPSLDAITIVEMFRRSAFWARVRSSLVVRLVFGLVGGLVVGLFLGSARLPVAALVSGLVSGLVLGLAEKPHPSLGTITVVEMFRWSWSAFWEGIRSRLVMGFVFGVVGGLVYVLFGRLANAPSNGVLVLLFGLVGGLVFGVIFGLVDGLLKGLSVQTLETRSYSNQGIWRSLRSAQVAGPVVGLVSGLVSGLLLGLGGGLLLVLVDRPVYGLLLGLVGGLLLGLVGGLFGTWYRGGKTCSQHLILRFLLWRSGVLPWNVAAFLDEATERILLRKVGGGYIFIHRLLLEYFARLGDTDTEGGSDGEQGSKAVVQG